MAKGKQMAFRGGISELMKQAHRIQTKLEKAKADIKEQSWTAEAAGGKVKITINGAKEVTGLEIDEALIDPAEIETLTDVIISAVNAAISLAEERIEAATEEATGGLRIPGMF
jgi:hypothetical protein